MAQDENQNQPERGASPSGTGAQQSASLTTANWPHANLDYANTRAVTDSKINSSNVHTLGTAWKFPVPGVGAFGAIASGMVVVEGVIYLQDLASNLYAVDLASGKQKWKKTYNASVIGPNGPAVWQGKVFAHVGPTDLKALDQNTGEELWSIDLQGPTGAQQPLVYENLVYTGVTVGAVEKKTPIGQIALRAYSGGKSGHAIAVNQESGKVVWDFATVTKGFWGNPQLNSGGGIWYPPAIDPKNGLSFWGTGNPAPFPGTIDYPNGSSRPAPNLYSCSVLALDLKSGELKWYYQFLEHDLFDHDAQISPVLATAQIDGKERDIVIGGGKLGEVAALDRKTGELLWRIKVGKHVNDELKELPKDQIVMVYPGILGGVETPMAVADGVLYVPVVNLAAPFTSTGFDSKDGVQATLEVEGRLDFNEGNGEMIAIDLSNGVVLWEQTFTSEVFSAATVVNDLVFTATYDGTVYALDKKDGSVLWSQKMPGGINGFLTVVGDMVLVPVGVTGHPSVVALRLGAQGQPQQEELPPAKQQTEADADLVPFPVGVAKPTPKSSLSQQQQQLIDEGKKIYMDFGARCHQMNGQGAKGAIPKLADSSFVNGDPQQVIHMVLYGEGAMPAWIKVLDNEQIAAVVSYIRNAWGNQASPVTAEQVQQVKDQNKGKSLGEEQAHNREETPGKDEYPYNRSQ